MDQVPAAPAAEVVTPAPGVQTPPAADAPPPEAPKPDRVFTQAELDEIIKKKDAKRLRERDELRRENEVLRKLALERAAERERQEAQPEQPKATPAGEPTRDQFGTYEEFIEARAEWRADQRVDKKFKEREDADRQRSAQTEAEKAGEEFRKRAKETAKDMPDYDEVMADIKPTDPVARIAADPIASADQPGKLLYHLAKNPEEAERIASLPMGQQAREIWKLEQSLLTAKPPVKPSKAPDPISPVGGKAAVGDEMPDAKTQPEKWMKWRQAQLAAKAKGARA